MKIIASLEETIFGFLEKTGQLLLLGFVWILCCIPVVTIGASTTALYYAVVKAVRKERGYPLKEFFDMFKQCILKATAITIMQIMIMALSLVGIVYIRMDNAIFFPDNDKIKQVIYVIYCGIVIVLIATSVYIFPVLSRFKMKLKDMIKLSFFISIRYIYITVAVLIIAALGAYSLLFMPIYAAIVYPGIVTYVTSFLIEKAMKKYITVTDDNKDEWYIF